MKKYIRWIVIFLFIIIILIGSIFLLAWIYRDDLASQIKQKINENVEAQVEFENYSIRLLKHFPNAGLTIQNLDIQGKDHFGQDTLFHADFLDVEVDLKSLIKKPFQIKSIQIENPIINAVVLEDGRVNWDIFPAEQMPQPDQPAEESIDFNINEILCHGGLIRYNDAESNIHSILNEVDIDLWKRNKDSHWETIISVANMHADMESMPLLTDAMAHFDGNIAFDPDSFKISFGDNSFQLNEMLFEIKGSVAMPDTTIYTDLQFHSTHSQFKNLLSLIPIIYRNDFPSLVAHGNFNFAGHIQGAYDGSQFPESEFQLKVSNGGFSYPDMPKKATEVNLDFYLSNADGEMDATVIHLKQFHALIGGDPIKLSFFLKNPSSSPFVQLDLKTNMNLAHWKELIPLEGTEKLSGKLDAEMAIEGLVSEASSGQFNNIKANGQIKANKIHFANNNIPNEVFIDLMKIDLDPSAIIIENLHAKGGQSDLNLSGKVNNYLSWFFDKGKIETDLELYSANLDINEWMGKEADVSIQSPADSLEEMPIDIPNNINGNIKLIAEHVQYENYELKNVNATLMLENGSLHFKPLKAEMLGGLVEIDGKFIDGGILGTANSMELNMTLNQLDMKESVTSFNTVQSLAPIASRFHGKYQASLNLNSKLGKGFSPDLSSLDALLQFKTDKLTIEKTDIFKQISQLTGSTYFDTPTLSKVNALIKMKDGMLEVLPFDTRIGEASLNIAGKQGLDGKLDYILQFDIPSHLLKTDSMQVIKNLFKLSGEKGISLKWPERIHFDALINGSLKKPVITLNLKDQIGAVKDQLIETVKEKAEDKVDQAKSNAIKMAEKKAEALIQTAQKKGDLLIAETRKKAEKMQLEVNKKIDFLKNEANKKANNVVGKAGNNPLKKIAAEETAKLIRKEADKKAEGLKAEVNTQTIKMIAEAEKQKEQWIREAEKQGNALIESAKK